MIVYLSVQELVVVVHTTGGRHLKGERGSFSVSKSGCASKLEAVICRPRVASEPNGGGRQCSLRSPLTLVQSRGGRRRSIALPKDSVKHQC